MHGMTILLASRHFAPTLSLTATVLAIVTPPEVLWLKSRRWQFGLGTLLGTALITVILCSLK